MGHYLEIAKRVKTIKRESTEPKQEGRIIARKIIETSCEKSELSEISGADSQVGEDHQGDQEKFPCTATDCFDPDGALASLLEWAKIKGISDVQVASVVDDLIKSKSLKAPWGIKIKNSPVLGDYWLVSDDQAKKHIPGNETAFTQDEIGILAEVREIFGIKAVEVKKYGTGKQAGN